MSSLASELDAAKREAEAKELELANVLTASQQREQELQVRFM